MKRTITVYILWIYCTNRFSYFEVYSCLRDAESTLDKLKHRRIDGRITSHTLHIEDLLETTEGDLIKNLNI